MTRRNELVPLDLKNALVATSTKRNSRETIDNYHHAMDAVTNDETMLKRWETYVKDYSYVGALTLPQACATVCEILDSIGW